MLLTVRGGPIAVVLVVLAGTCGRAAAHDTPAARSVASPLTATPHLAVIKPAPDFVLPDVDGRVVRLADLRGRVALVSFVYTTCRSACPLLTARLAQLQRQARALPVADRPLFVSVSVDPEHDTPERLREYAARFGADLASWRFLTDAPPRVEPVLRAWDEWTRRRADGEIDHPARVHLLDRAGRIREIYALEFFDARQAWLDVRRLVGEH